MKIGEFAEKHGVSKATVRYYIQMGLLNPHSPGSQLVFTSKDDWDISRILKFKNMRLNLDQIRELLFQERTSNFIETGTLDECIAILRNKQSELKQEEQEIKDSIKAVQTEIEALEARKVRVPKVRSGVSFRAAAILACPICGKNLKMEEAVIENQFILQAKLRCSSGYQGRIENGIVLTGLTYQGGHDWPDLQRKIYHETGREYSIASVKCTDFILQHLKRLDLQQKVILESNINGFFFMYKFLGQLSHDCLYVFVDKYPEVLMEYKKYLESLYDDLDALYIADAEGNYPLKEHSIDIWAGMFDEDEFSFYHPACQLHFIKKYLSPAVKIIGSHHSLPWNSQTRKNYFVKYPESEKNLFNMQAMQKDYEAEGFVLIPQLMGTAYQTLKHHSFECHVDGEPIELYGYTAVRKK